MRDNTLTAIIERSVNAIGMAAAVLILPNVAVIVVEVFLRYALDLPTVWINETSQFLFGFGFMLGGAFTLARGGHVRVDVVLHVLPQRARAWTELFAYPFIFFYLAVILWISGERAWESAAALERTDSAWGPYVFPLYAAVPLAVLLMLAQAGVLLVRDLRLAMRA